MSSQSGFFDTDVLAWVGANDATLRCKSRSVTEKWHAGILVPLEPYVTAYCQGSGRTPAEAIFHCEQERRSWLDKAKEKKNEEGEDEDGSDGDILQRNGNQNGDRGVEDDISGNLASNNDL